MNTVEAIRIALQSLWANKLRSVLTLLGVVIGVAAVIAVVTFVNGINGYVSEKIFNLGADVFILSKAPNVITNTDQYLESQRRKEVTLDDYDAVAAGCSACKFVGAMTPTANASVKYNEQSSADSWARGWTPSMGPIYDLDLASGRSITESDMNTGANVVVIGHDIQENLMGGVDPLGKEIRVDGHIYQVVGVATAKGQDARPEHGQLGDHADYDLAEAVWQPPHQHARVGEGLRHGAGAGCGDRPVEGHHCARGGTTPRASRDSFAAETNQNFLSIWADLSGTFFVVTIAIASIALMVGGIVIMNIMLVSVTERTREIGIRKAMGARRGDVMRQFLIESGTMALVGGILGRHRRGCGGKDRNAADRDAFGN